MKTALVTTTINVPHVLRLYRRCDPDVRFFIALDRKSPLDEIQRLDWVDDNMQWIRVEHQAEWKCSDLIGWSCIQRRNIATLEALRWGADLIVFVDDDNAPINTDYFSNYSGRYQYLAEFFDGMVMRRTWKATSGFSGLIAHPETDWFDVGAFLDPPSSHRGFPHQHARRKPRLSHVVAANIGAVAGIVMGDPDVSAITRIAKAPHVLNVSPLLNAGIAVDPRHTRTVFNTQNSAVLRDLAPAMLLCPQFRRYDDIIASLVCQRVMADTGHHVLFGPPFVYQERNAHDLGRDLADEAWGRANILKVQACLWNTKLEHDFSVVERVKILYAALDVRMPGVKALADAWCDDVAKAMA